MRSRVGEAAIELAKAGATVVGVDRLHVKAVVADDEAVVMTANLVANGLEQGCELGVVLDDEERLELLNVLDRWSATAPWRLVAGATVASVLGPVMDPLTGDRGTVAEVADTPGGKLRWAHRSRAKTRKRGGA